MKTLSFHFSSILWRSTNNPLRVAEKDIFYWSFYTWLCWSQTDLKPRSWICFYILTVFQLWIFRSTTFSKKHNFLKNSRYFFSIVNCFVWWWDLQYPEWFILPNTYNGVNDEKLLTIFAKKLHQRYLTASWSRLCLVLS